MLNAEHSSHMVEYKPPYLQTSDKFINIGDDVLVVGHTTQTSDDRKDSDDYDKCRN